MGLVNAFTEAVAGEDSGVDESTAFAFLSRFGFRSVDDFGYEETEVNFQKFVAEMERFNGHISLRTILQVAYVFEEWLEEKGVFMEDLVNQPAFSRVGLPVLACLKRLGFQSVLDFGYGDTKRYFQEFLAEMGRFNERISTFQVTYAFVEWLAERDIFVEDLMNVDQASGLDGEEETEYDWEDVKRRGLPQHLRVRSLFPVHRMPQPLRMWSRNRVHRLRQYSKNRGSSNLSVTDSAKKGGQYVLQAAFSAKERGRNVRQATCNATEGGRNVEWLAERDVSVEDLMNLGQASGLGHLRSSTPVRGVRHERLIPMTEEEIQRERATEWSFSVKGRNETGLSPPLRKSVVGSEGRRLPSSPREQRTPALDRQRDADPPISTAPTSKWSERLIPMTAEEIQRERATERSLSVKGRNEKGMSPPLQKNVVEYLAVM